MIPAPDVEDHWLRQPEGVWLLPEINSRGRSAASLSRRPCPGPNINGYYMPAPMNRFALCQMMVPHTSFEEDVAACAKAGYGGLRLVGPRVPNGREAELVWPGGT